MSEHSGQTVIRPLLALTGALFGIFAATVAFAPAHADWRGPALLVEGLAVGVCLGVLWAQSERRDHMIERLEQKDC